ncbi:MAG: signal peptidase II [Phycisphaeraceae bacterium]
MSHPQPTLQPAGRSTRAIGLFLGVLVGLLALDLIVKYLAFAYLGPQPVDIPAVLEGQQPLPDDTRIVIPYLLGFKLTLNPGAVFGLWAGYRWMFIVATFVAVAIVSYFFYTSDRRERIVHIALAGILAGALGNLYDRIVYSVVRDMLWLFPNLELPFGWTWPGGSPYLYPWLFNLADAYLLIGIFVVLIRSITTDIQRARQQKQEAKSDTP